MASPRQGWSNLCNQNGEVKIFGPVVEKLKQDIAMAQRIHAAGIDDIATVIAAVSDDEAWAKISTAMQWDPTFSEHTRTSVRSWEEYKACSKLFETSIVCEALAHVWMATLASASDVMARTNGCAFQVSAYPSSESVWTTTFENAVTTALFVCSDSRLLISVRDCPYVRMHDAATGKEIGRLEIPDMKDRDMRIIGNKGANEFAVVCTRTVHDQHMYYCDLRGEAPIIVSSGIISGYSDTFHCIDPQGSAVVTSSHFVQTRRYLLPGFTMCSANQDAYKHIYCHMTIFTRADGGKRMIGILGNRSSIAIWQYPSGRMLTGFPDAGRHIFDISISADDRILAVCDFRTAFHLWSVEARSLIRTVESSSVWLCRFSGSGNFLVTGTTNNFIIYEKDDGLRLAAKYAHLKGPARKSSRPAIAAADAEDAGPSSKKAKTEEDEKSA